jgi:hypothetical protein
MLSGDHPDAESGHPMGMNRREFANADEQRWEHGPHASA